jgi:hypothetical protein
MVGACRGCKQLGMPRVGHDSGSYCLPANGVATATTQLKMHHFCSVVTAWLAHVQSVPVGDASSRQDWFVAITCSGWCLPMV